MPFRSRKQWGWAFANKKPWAKGWANETKGGRKSLPNQAKKKK